MAISFEGAHFPKEIISAWIPQRPATFLGGAGDFDVGVQAVCDTLIDGSDWASSLAWSICNVS